MSNRSIPLTDSLYEYLLAVSLREPALLAELRAETARDPENVQLQIAPEQGQLMAFLVRLMGARRCLELGVFTGYSSLVTALALPEDGRLVACDISEEWTAVARRYWQRAGVAHKIDLRLAPALVTLDALTAQGGAGSFDFAFLDADKENYPTYYERILTLLRSGGVLAIDNTFWSGKVTDPRETDAETTALRVLNERLHDDGRIDLTMLPVADGLTLVRKR
jgi:predicted O-methyltransferase YrrM